MKIVNNSLLQISERLFNLAGSFFVGILLIKYLGPTNFGVYSYSVSYTAIFLTIANMGATASTWELAQNPEEHNYILGSVFFLKLISSLIGIVFAISTYFIFCLNNLLILKLIIILSIANSLSSFSIINYYFRASVKTQKIAMVALIIDVVDLIGDILIIKLKLSIIYLGYLTLLENCLQMSCLVYFYTTHEYKVSYWKFSYRHFRSIFKKSLPFAVSGLCVILYAKIDQMVLNHYHGATTVGYYNVAIKLIEVFYIMSTILAPNLIPLVNEIRAKSTIEFENYIQALYTAIIYIGIICVLVAYVLAPYLIPMLFGAKFIPCVKIFQIGICNIIFVYIATFSSLWTIANNMYRFEIFRNFIGFIVNLGVSLLLIPSYGAIGAIVSVLVTYFSVCCVSFVFSKQSYRNLILLFRSLYQLNNLTNLFRVTKNN